jgi:opine dehydrogenase
MLWSPSGAGTSDLLLVSDSSEAPQVCAYGAIEDYSFTPRIATSSESLAKSNDVLIIALPANGHKRVFDELAPFIQPGQPIIISSHASLGAIYLSQLLQEHLGEETAATIPITAWGTTVCTARRPSGNKVRINTVRQSVDLCTVPNEKSQNGLFLCQRLFGRNDVQFRQRDGLLAISLSNLNPQNHLGIALGNMGRMEKGEAWYQSLNITPNIGRFLETLDKERLDIAEALGLEVKTIFEHFSLSFHVPITDSISDMNQAIHAVGNDVFGPNVADSRYIIEDVPFGLGLTIALGNLVNRPAVLHQAGVQIVSAMYGRDFMEENDLLEALNLGQFSLEDLQEAAYSGVLQCSSTQKSLKL